MRADYIKPSVYTRIYHLMQYENALALRLSLETGLRIGDCLALTPAQLQGQTISYTAQKQERGVKKELLPTLRTAYAKSAVKSLFSRGATVTSHEHGKPCGKMLKKQVP